MGRPLIGRREIKFPVSESMYVALRAEARAMGVPMVALVRSLIEEHLRAAEAERLSKKEVAR